MWRRSSAGRRIKGNRPWRRDFVLVLMPSPVRLSTLIAENPLCNWSIVLLLTTSPFVPSISFSSDPDSIHAYEFSCELIVIKNCKYFVDERSKGQKVFVVKKGRGLREATDRREVVGKLYTYQLGYCTQRFRKERCPRVWLHHNTPLSDHCFRPV